jgi:hypothetical protein
MDGKPISTEVKSDLWQREALDSVSRRVAEEEKSTLIVALVETTAGLQTLAEVLESLLPGLANRSLKSQIGAAVVAAKDQCELNRALISRYQETRPANANNGNEKETNDEPSSSE